MRSRTKLQAIVVSLAAIGILATPGCNTASKNIALTEAATGDVKAAPVIPGIQPARDVPPAPPAQ